MKKDTAAVNFATSSGQRVCPITRRAVTEEGRFTVGWKCGCVVADAAAQGMRDVESGVHHGEDGGEASCVVCQIRGERVRLGLTLEERNRIREGLEKERVERKSKKRKRVGAACDNAACDNSVEQKVPRVAEEPVK